MTDVTGGRAWKQARMVAAALLLAGLSMSMVAGAASAVTNEPPKDPGQVYCAHTNADGEAEVFLPGESYTTQVKGKRVRATCGSDGKWYVSRTEGVESPRTPGGGVYAP